MRRSEAVRARFELGRALGAGSFGAVYEAFDRVLGGLVALKHLIHADAHAVASFRDEFRLLAEVHHPHLVSLHELFEIEGHWLLSMELVRGVDLLNHIGARRESESKTLDYESASPAEWSVGYTPDTPDVRRCTSAVLGLARGIAALHAAGRLHRDIKPSNVLVEQPSGRIVVLDFGLALALREGSTPHASQRIAGTPHYMAPEQVLGERLTTASDWYSVGTILYEGFAGRSPFAGDVATVLNAKLASEPPRLSLVARDVPPEIDELCAALLRRDPSRRPGPEHVLRVLGAFACESPVHVSISPPPARQAGFVGRRFELGELDRILREAEQGERVAVLVSGPSGIGKTELCSRWIASIGSERAVVAKGRCYQRESVSYRGVEELVVELANQAGFVDENTLLPANRFALAKAFPKLARVMRAPSSGSVPRSMLRVQAIEGLHVLTETARSGRTVILWLDDVQWMDGDGADFLRDWIEASRDLPIMLVMSARADELPAGLRAALRGFEISELAIGPLDAHDSDALLRSMADEVSESVLSAIRTESHGNPFLLSAHARSIHARRSGGSESAAGAGRLLSAWSDALDTDWIRLLETLAVAGGPLAKRFALESSGIPSARRIKLVQLMTWCLVRGVRDSDQIDLYHDRIREALLDAMNAERKTLIHRNLAHALAASEDSDPAAVAAHARAAGEREMEVRFLVLAAERAAQGLRFAAAARYYGAAIGRLGPDVTLELRAEYAESLRHSGRVAQGAEELISIAEEASEPWATELRARAGEVLLHAGDVTRGERVLRDVFVDHGIVWPETRWEALRLLVGLNVRGVRKREPMPRALDISTCDVLFGACTGLIVVDPLRFYSVQGQLWGMAGDATSVELRARAVVSQVARLSLRSSRVRPRLDALRAELHTVIRDSSKRRTRLMAATVAGISRVQAGEFVDGARELGLAIHDLEAAGLEGSWERARGLQVLLVALLQLGRITELRDTVRALDAESAAGGNLHTRRLAAAYGVIPALAADDVDTAEALLATAPAIGTRGGTSEYHEAGAALHLALYRGEAERATSIAREGFGRVALAGVLLIQNLRFYALACTARASMIQLAAHGANSRSVAIIRAVVFWLRAGGSDWSRCLGELLAASLLALYDKGRSADALDHVALACDRQRLAVYAAGARHQAARLRGRPSSLEGSSLEGSSLEGSSLDRVCAPIRDPDRFFRVFVPLPISLDQHDGSAWTDQVSP